MALLVFMKPYRLTMFFLGYIAVMVTVLFVLAVLGHGS